MKTAARELADYLRKITGAEPAIVPGGDRAGRRIILEEGGTGLKNDGYRIQTRDEALYITGENGRGTLYGVYGFLEKYLGSDQLTDQQIELLLKTLFRRPDVHELIQQIKQERYVLLFFN